MSTTPITPEVRAEILASLKKGTPITEAAQKHNLTEDTIRRWIRKGSNKTNSNNPALARALREIQQLKELLGSILLERELMKKNSSRS